MKGDERGKTLSVRVLNGGGQVFLTQTIERSGGERGGGVGGGGGGF